MSNYTYVIVNKINLKLYFGSHSWDGEGLDPNYYGSGKIIKQAIKKYGKDNFIVYPIKFYDTVEECRQAEEELLIKYNIADNPYCYNLKNGAIGWTSADVAGEKNYMYGKHLSEENRRKLSQANKGKTLSDEHRKKLSQLMKMKTASEEYRKKLSQAMTGEKNPMYGKRGENHPLYGKRLSDEHRKKLSQANNYKKIPIVAIQKDTGKIRVFESQNECARQLNLNQSKISKCLLGKRNHTGGYTFKYIEQLESGIYEGITELALEPSKTAPTPVIAIQKDTGKIRMIKSQSECARQLNLDPGHICNCLKGRLKSTGGYTFKKINRDRRVFTVSQRSKADLNVLRGIAE